MQVSVHKWFDSEDNALAALFQEGMPFFPVPCPKDWYCVRQGDTAYIGKIERGTGASKDCWLMGFAIVE